MSRKSNVELAANFRFLLTTGAKAALTPELLEATKPWRNELWRAFHEIEDRLDPIGSMERLKSYERKIGLSK